MDTLLPIGQLTLGLLSLPLLTALGTWVWRRVSKEARLHAELERLARVFPTLPDGEAKVTYAERVNDVLEALNTRLDPLFKRERRRKRVVVVIVLAFVFIVSLIVAPSLNGVSDDSYTSVLGIALGGVVVAAFWFIERDTKRQREALRLAAESPNRLSEPVSAV